MPSPAASQVSLKTHLIRALCVVFVVGAVLGTVMLSNGDHMVEDLNRLKHNPDIEVVGSDFKTGEVRVRIKKTGGEEAMVYEPGARTFKVVK